MLGAQAIIIAYKKKRRRIFGIIVLANWMSVIGLRRLLTNHTAGFHTILVNVTQVVCQVAQFWLQTLVNKECYLSRNIGVNNKT